MALRFSYATLRSQPVAPFNPRLCTPSKSSDLQRPSGQIEPAHTQVGDPQPRIFINGPTFPDLKGCDNRLIIPMSKMRFERSQSDF